MFQVTFSEQSLSILEGLSRSEQLVVIEKMSSLGNSIVSGEASNLGKFTRKGKTIYRMRFGGLRIYFEKNGELIYAKETQNYMPKNHFTQMAWNCEFYAKNGKLIAIMSLGHGKTEDEEWNPDVIFDMYKNRLTELKRIKK